MSITERPERYVGRLLYLKPGYGWGWNGVSDETSIDYAPIDAAGGCHVRICRFFSWHNEVRGVVGKVEEAEHIFNGLWFVGATMLVGEWDFTDRLCWRYDLELGSMEPNEEEWPRLIHGRYYGGYGILAESAQYVAQWWESQERKSMGTIEAKHA
jgi:hypothetical protein